MAITNTTTGRSFLKIQDAINNAFAIGLNADMTIQVGAGIYNEVLSINHLQPQSTGGEHTLKIVGVGSPRIDGDNKSNFCLILNKCSNIEFDGINFTGASKQNVNGACINFIGDPENADILKNITIKNGSISNSYRGVKFKGLFSNIEFETVSLTGNVYEDIDISEDQINGINFSAVTFQKPNNDGFDISVALAAPVVTLQPVDANINEGENVYFVIENTANPEPSYQWQKNSGGDWENIEGAISDDYFFTPEFSENATNYRCVITNSQGSVNSDLASLLITEDPATKKPIWEHVVKEFKTVKESIENLPALQIDDAVAESLAVTTEVRSIVENGNFPTGETLNFTANKPTVVDIPNPPYYLQKIGATRGFKLTGAQDEFYWKSNGDTPLPAPYDFVKWEYFIFIPAGNFPPTVDRAKMLLFKDLGGQLNSASATVTKIAAGLYKMSGEVSLNEASEYSSYWIENFWSEADRPTGEIYFTALKIAYFGTSNFSINSDFADTEAIVKANNEKIALLENPVIELPYNNIGYNMAQCAEGIYKLKNKIVDQFNQFTLLFRSDSIFARQYLLEMSLTSGEDDGSFPPNMWQQNVPYLVLEALQFNDADVKYRNLAHADFTKNGAWPNDLGHQDSLRVFKTDTNTDYFEITVTGAAFAKMVWYYKDGGTTFDVLVNGVAPSTLGITSDNADVDSFSSDRLGGKRLKWANKIWSGLDPAIAYTFRFTNTGGNICHVWGVESWEKPRLNVINGGEGGITAKNHLDYIHQFSNDVYRPDLIIHELPMLNDAFTTQSKGFVSPEDAETVAVDDDFIIADSDGVFINHSNLSMLKGQYAEKVGVNWVLGSTNIEAIESSYRTRILYLEAIAECGVPTLVMSPHKDLTFDDRPWQKQLLRIARTVVNRLGMAFVDMDLKDYIFQTDATTITSDGTHLNDEGNQWYLDEILKVLNEYREAAVANKGYACKVKSGTVAAGASRTVDFDLSYQENPEVEIFPFHDGVTAPEFMYITEITKDSFTISGLGAFSWKSYRSGKL